MLLEKILPIDYYAHLMGVRADSVLFAEILFPQILPECHLKLKQYNLNPII